MLDSGVTSIPKFTGHGNSGCHVPKAWLASISGCSKEYVSSQTVLWLTYTRWSQGSIQYLIILWVHTVLFNFMTLMHFLSDRFVNDDASIICMHPCTGGAWPQAARACAPVCPSLATPLMLVTTDNFESYKHPNVMHCIAGKLWSSFMYRPLSSFHHLQYRKTGRAWYLFSCEHDKMLEQAGCTSHIVRWTTPSMLSVYIWQSPPLIARYAC